MYLISGARCGAKASKHRIVNPWSTKVNGNSFEIMIAAFDEYYKVYFNGAPLNRNFRYELDSDIALVKSIVLAGGKKGFKWKTVVMPGEQKFGK